MASITPTLEGWVYIIPIHGPLKRIMASIPPTLEEWVYIIPIHGPLDGPLYTWAQYTPTPLRSLNYRRSGVQDWTTRKLTPPNTPCSLNNRRSGIQDWTR